ncbi:cytochrome P450 [Pterulicium gracile]|uniref:Cytochrome P450 n=1 Tax=Pterulicium gracile TaxID=1884261 RepID=A0A5C3Q7M9_9AGAR|nr:cytochrome P450 [Pterula gracilis]
MTRALEFIVAVLSLVLLRLWVTRVNLDHIPAIGRSGILTSYLDIKAFRRNGVAMVAKAYHELQGRMFKIPFITSWAVIVGDPKFVDEIKNAKDDELSFEVANHEFMQQKYTLGFHDDSGSVTHAVRSSLTRNIAARFDDIRDEIEDAFTTCLPAEVESEWVPIMPLLAMRDIVCRISNRLFVGLPLCRDPDWMDLNIQFTIDAFQNAEKIKKWPDLFKPIVGRYYSPHQRAYRRAYKHIGPTVQERIDTWGEKEAPNDLITWLLENAPEDRRTVEHLLMAIIVVNMAAIHTSSNTFAYVLFHLASHPECVEPMLQEVEQVTEEMGWTKAAMNMMRKVDSFIRESQRISNLGSFSMRRTVIHPSGFTFSDGTHLPKGTLVLVATAAIHLDEKNFVNPAEFDGMRFAKMREGGEREDSARHQMVNTNGTNLSFGNGRHACPGRFFAANELKAMLAHVLLNYDVKMKDDGQSCGNYEWDFQMVPTAEKILWRKRK